MNIQTGHWVGKQSGLGAGSDSFYEYLLKSYILFGEKEDLEMFNDAYRNIQNHLRRGYVLSSKYQFLKAMSTPARYERLCSVLCHGLEKPLFSLFSLNNLVSVVVNMEIKCNIPFSP